MRKISALVLVVGLALVAGCGDSHESLISEGMGEMKQLVTVLEGVNSEADAKAAVPKIEAIAARMKELEKRSKELPKLDAKEEEALMKKFQTEMEDIQKRMGAVMGKMITKPEIAKALEKPMEEAMKAMK